GANHAEGMVHTRAHSPLGHRCIEAGPAGSTLELRAGVEQHLTATGAEILSRALLVVERAGSRVLGPVASQHLVLLRCQLLLPFLVAGRQAGRTFDRITGHVYPPFSYSEASRSRVHVRPPRPAGAREHTRLVCSKHAEGRR